MVDANKGLSKQDSNVGAGVLMAVSRPGGLLWVLSRRVIRGVTLANIEMKPSVGYNLMRVITSGSRRK